MKRVLVVVGAAVVLGAMAGNDYPIKSAAMRNVQVKEGFWLSRFETNRLVTLKTDFAKCNETPRIANFTNAANRAWGTFGGIPFDDSDVYKVMEGAAYVLALHPDRKLEDYMGWFIGQIARAQEPDGYLYTARTLGFTYKDKHGRPTFGMMGPTRWSNCPSSHELYNVGHMYEAAVAWYEATGRKDFLDIARKSADLVARTFGPGENQLKAVPGHEEIELALVKLYRATGEKRYLDLAKHFLDQRGAQNGDKRDAAVFTQAGDLVFDKEMAMPGAYCQNHLPVKLQTRALGHAVRAAYLYCGMADVAALTGDADYLKAIQTIWQNVVERKLHLNGGIGARHRGEAFGADFELPNASAYLETCAAIGNALWNDRLFRFTGDAKYMDVVERVIYNGFLSGISLGGDEFFYPNPLASSGGYKRSKWFGCSCCPVNVVRFIPQIASFAYATRGDEAFVNLFLASEAKLPLASGAVTIAQETAYPWKGAVKLRVTPAADGQRFSLKVRIPGWAQGRPVPSGLYAQTAPSSLQQVKLSVNGVVREGALALDKGYACIDRAWKAGDVVELSLPMDIKRIRADERVEADRGRLAVERGPILWCAEGADNAGRRVFNATLPPDATFTETSVEVCGQTFPALKASNGLTLIPYFAWDHRDPGNPMETWFATEPQAEYSASHCWEGDSVEAAFDGEAPNVGDLSARGRRLTFWPHCGGTEWAQTTFPKARAVSGVDVFWFDDEKAGGQCRTPMSWKVQVRAAGASAWTDVPAVYEVKKGDWSRAVFTQPVASVESVRLVVTQREKFSSGAFEIKVR